MNNQLRSLCILCLAALATGCDSDNGGQGGAPQPGPSATGAASASNPTRDQEDPGTGPAGQDATANPEPGIDPAEWAWAAAFQPDAAIQQYTQACNAQDRSPSCRALRRRVELLLLEAIVFLRGAGEKLDPRLYRIAAQAEQPQLAIIGLREMIYAPGPLATEDLALIVAALDSPYRGVRRTVLESGQRVASINELWPRVASAAVTDASLALLDEARDSAPDAGVVGSYPGARYRYFASDPTRHWFTSPDSVDQVVAFFSRHGKPARGAEAFKEEAQADVQNEYMNAMMSGDENRAMQIMQRMTGAQGIDWTSLLDDSGGMGEIRYIRLSPEQVIAVFADEILDASSLVAFVPAPAAAAVGFNPMENVDYEQALEDVQKAEALEARVRRVLGR